MQKMSILKGSFAAAASVSLLVACGPAPTTTAPSASPSASASVAPSAAPTAAPSVAPTAAPSVAPTAAPTAAPSAAPSASVAPSAAPTATPLPAATSDISVVEKTTFNGKVYDDTEAPLEGVKVTVKSLNSSVPFTAETTTAGGTYSFNNAPSGVQIEITATKPGYTTRRRVEVLKSNKQGDPNANRYDFGSDGNENFGTSYTALSDKPEVTMVTPGRNASGVDPKTSFVLKFSEPMDIESVEDAISVHVYEDQQLSVDTLNTDGTFDELSGKGGYTDSDSFTSASLVWDESDFNFSWNSDDTEVTLTFNYEKLLPTDKDSANVPDYLITFMNDGAGTLKDKSGILRREEWFKLTEGDFESYYKFAIKTDEVKPTVKSIIATSSEGGSLRGDAIKVLYSERMLIDTKSGDVGSSNRNLNGEAAADVLNPTLYTVSVSRGSTLECTYNWGDEDLDANGTGSCRPRTSDGSAVFDADDLTRKTVILLPGTGTVTDGSTNDIFERSDVIKVTVASSVVDPAGNTLDSKGNDKTSTAG